MMKKLIFLIFTIAPCWIGGMVHADNYYIGHWSWNSEGYWEVPQRSSATGMLDLRSNSQCASRGPSPQGWALFAYSSPQTDANLALDLGTNLNATMTISTLTWLRNNISSAPIAALTIKSALWAIVNSLADPTGVTKVKNMMPDNQGNLNLVIAGNIILSKRVVPFKSPEWANILKQHQMDYATIRRDVQYAMLPPNFHREQLSYWSQLYGVDYHVFIPKGLPDETPVAYGTTISENFNCANNAGSMNCQQTWTLTGDGGGEQFGINSSSGRNEIAAGVFNYARAETDVASANHASQMDVTQMITGGGSLRFTDTMARYDSSAPADSGVDYGYMCGAGQLGDGLDYVLFQKNVRGVLTVLDPQASSTVSPFPATVILTVNGSNMKCSYKGTQINNFTDTTFSTGTRGGIGSRTNSGVGDSCWDNWSLTDLAAAGAATPVPHKQRMMIY